MRFQALLGTAVVVLLAGCSGDASTSRSPTPPLLSLSASAAPQNDFQWGPAPPVFPPGAEMAVLQGDPGSNNEFTVRLRFPNGYRIPAHTHPTAENVTVLEGTFLAGMGQRYRVCRIGRQQPLCPECQHGTSDYLRHDARL